MKCVLFVLVMGEREATVKVLWGATKDSTL